jgi:plasmid stabilization system protein ParE
MGAYLSPQAETDLENIFEYIRKQSPRNADEFLTRVEAVLARVEAEPYALRLRDDELPVPGLRIARADPALLIDRVCDNGDAEVVRIAHGRQDLPALLAPSEM